MAQLPLAFLMLTSALWVSWIRFPSVWTDDRNNGFAISALTAWVLWRDRASLSGTGSSTSWPVPVLFALSLLWFLAVAMSAQTIHLTLVPGILLVWLVAVRGEHAARTGAQAAALFSLALPVWGYLIPLLQSITVAVNRALIFVTRIPASVEGSLIHLKAGTLHVADSCAGFNFLMAGLTVGAGYAFLFTKAWRVRWKIIVAAGVLSIVSNWARVFGLVAVGHVTEMRSSLMHDHVVYGWLIFAATIPMVFYLAGRIERVESAAVAAPEIGLEHHSESEGLSPALGRVARVTSVALVGPFILYGLDAVQPQAIMTDTVPGVVINTPAPVASLGNLRWAPAFNGEQARNTTMMQVSGQRVQLDRYLYASGNDEAEMIGSENVLAADSLIAATGNVGPLDNGLRMTREALLRTPDKNGRLVWYWYAVAGVITHSPLRAKLLELWAFVTRQPSSQIVVLSAACDMGNCEVARRALFVVATGRDMAGALR